jgi:hypothetical protein
MPKIWLIGGVVLLTVLVVASIVVGLTRREKPLPEGTPERVVQRFLNAIGDEDLKVAYALLSDELKQACSIEQFAGNTFGRKRDLKNSRVTLKETKHLDGPAIVIARVSSISGSGPFRTSEHAREERFTLVQEEGQWRFSASPWPYYGCGTPDIYSPRPAIPAPTLAPPAATTTPATVP